MSDLFQLPVGSRGEVPANPFAKYGLEGNPFPAVGLDSGVLYTQHMKAELGTVNGWIQEVGRATGRDGNAGPVPPLAVYGSLGVGKTHLLRTLEVGLHQDRRTPVLRRALTEEGMTRLVLANLILRYLPFSDQGDQPATRLIQLLTDQLRESESRAHDLLGVLSEGSPLVHPFGALRRASIEDEATTWLSRWLRREYTTPAQRSKLGIAGVLESEGQAIRAVADLLRMARAAGLVQVWFVMLDQLEELWRAGVVTASRRARFLTDLRLLVDLAQEGAPIALLLAWNTHTKAARGMANVNTQIEHDYHALWRRLGTRVDLPQLTHDDIWPFALEYLTAVGVTSDAPQPRLLLYDLLHDQRDKVINRLRGEAVGSSYFATYKVLEVWRAAATNVAMGG